MDELVEPGAESVEAKMAWERLRHDYEAGYLTLNAIARGHGRTRREIEARAKKNRWKRPAGLILDRQILIHKLMALLERQIDLLEQRMNNDTLIESKVLGDLVRDLDRLIAIEKAEAFANGEENTGEVSALRRKLEARINAITKGRA